MALSQDKKYNILTNRSQWDLNPRPLDSESNAISTSLCDRMCHETKFSLVQFNITIVNSPMNEFATQIKTKRTALQRSNNRLT